MAALAPRGGSAAREVKAAATAASTIKTLTSSCESLSFRTTVMELSLLLTPLFQKRNRPPSLRWLVVLPISPYPKPTFATEFVVSTRSPTSFCSDRDGGFARLDQPDGTFLLLLEACIQLLSSLICAPGIGGPNWARRTARMQKARKVRGSLLLWIPDQLHNAGPGWPRSAPRIATPRWPRS